MPKTLVRIAKDIAGKMETLDLANSEGLSTVRIQQLKDQCRAAFHRTPPTLAQKTAIAALRHTFAEAEAKRALEFAALHAKERAAMITELEAELTILEHHGE